MGEKNRYNIKLGKETYNITTFRSKEETDEIVKYVDEEIIKAQNHIRYRNPSMHATLACLNIADKLYEIKSSYNELKKQALIPIREYEPLKRSYENKMHEFNNIEEKTKQLQDQIENLKKELEIITLDRDNYKLELDRKIKASEQMKESVDDLREKLLAQEKITLQANRQIQELIRINENK